MYFSSFFFFEISGEIEFLVMDIIFGELLEIFNEFTIFVYVVSVLIKEEINNILFKYKERSENRDVNEK